MAATVSNRKAAPAALWVGTDPLVAAPMKDREIFDLLGFD